MREGSSTADNCEAEAPTGASLLRQGARLADVYQIVLHVENGDYVGRGVELPTVTGRGATPNACVRATRAALAKAVAEMLAAGEAPPASVFPPSGRAAGRARAGTWTMRAAWAAAAVCAIGLVVIVFAGAESVIVSGPLIGALGSTLIGLGCAARYRPAIALGAAHVGICLAFVGMVNVFNLSPRSAYWPFLYVGGVYVAAVGVATRWLARRAATANVPWACEGCGYLLFGLPEPRCPECGRGFDPRRWAGIPPPEPLGRST